MKRQGKAGSTIDTRTTEFFDCPSDVLALEQFEAYFEALVQAQSSLTVKIDRNGLQFFDKYILKKEWSWVDIAPRAQDKTLPDVLTLKEIECLLNGTCELRSPRMPHRIREHGSRSTTKIFQSHLDNGLVIGSSSAKVHIVYQPGE